MKGAYAQPNFDEIRRAPSMVTECAGRLRGDPRYCGLALPRSAESRGVVASATGARRRLRYHSATANEYCPSSSTVARHKIKGLLGRACGRAVPSYPIGTGRLVAA
jgi:hypothetical protein